MYICHRSLFCIAKYAEVLNELLEVFWCLFSGINLARADSLQNFNLSYLINFFCSTDRPSPGRLCAPGRNMLFQVLEQWEAWQDLSFVRYFCTLFFKEMNSNNEFFIMHNPRWLLMVSQLLIFLIFFCFCIITFIKIAVWFKSLLPCIWPQNLIN